MAQPALPTDSQLLDFWTRVIDPRGIGMADAIATEIAAFTGEPTAVVLAKMSRGKEDLKELWLNQKIDHKEAAQVEAFYRDQLVEAYELANWHCGRTNGEPPTNYAFAALLAKQVGARRILDFGSGIGTGSLAFASLGCEVHSADIANRLLDLVEHRMKARGYAPHLVRLSEGQRPLRGFYDLITCFDVLEHVVDQHAKLRELESYLKVGGYLIVNLMADSHDEDRPMHISSSGNWLRLVRRTGLQPVWPYVTGSVQVLVRTRFAHLHNALATIVDRVQGV
jgi:2-polyprenyl-3-methyl-5-hydroxy-6-metoxy-1,4-benzoquinol methylase